MPNYNANSTNYTHSFEPNTTQLTHAMDYNEAGQPIIRTTGSSLDWAINLSAGNIPGVQYIEKFGMNVDVDNNKETVWDGGGIYTHISGAETVAVTSDSPLNDNATGTGARTVEISGLDENWLMASETVTVGGASTTTTFTRVSRAKVITTGSNEVNEGTLSIISDSTSTTLAQICVDGTGSNAAGRGQTFMSVYTIPAGKTGYLTQWTVGAGKQNTDAIAFFMTRNIEVDGWQAKDVITTSATTYSKDYVIPLKFTQKTDLEVRAYSTTNNSIVSSTFNLILIDNT